MQQHATKGGEATPRTPAPAERSPDAAALEDHSPAGQAVKAFADLANNGPRATAQRQALGAMFGASHSSRAALATPAGPPVAQRKLDFAGEAERLSKTMEDVYAGEGERERVQAGETKIKDLHRRFMASIQKHRAQLEEWGARDAKEEIREVIANFDIYLAFENNLYSQVNSPVDYGVINLDNPQHLYTFLKQAHAFLTRDGLYKKTAAAEAEAESQRPKSPGTTKGPPPRDSAGVFDVVLLGAGASVANYLNVHGSSLDPRRTAIIGESQPWRPSATDPRSRGIGFVNHPASMTSPQRNTTKLPERDRDENFATAATALSEDIDSVIAHFGGERIVAKIASVARLPDTDWYAITAGGRVYHAARVVSGLGIGAHAMDRSDKATSAPSGTVGHDHELARVIDLDTFQRELSRDGSDVGRARKIAVSGPNAGTDAVYTAVAKGMEVHWIVSSAGPAIAEGMGNRISNPAAVTLYFNRLTMRAPAADKVTLTIAARAKEVREADEKKFLERVPNRGAWEGRMSTATSVEVDYLVIAMGPDVESVFTTFDKSATRGLTLKDDEVGRFGAPSSDKSAWQGEITASSRSSPYNIRYVSLERVAEAAIGEAMGVVGRYAVVAQLRDHLTAEALKVLGVDDFDRIELERTTAPRLASGDDSLEIIGGSAIRILDFVDQLMAKQGEKESLKDFEARKKKAEELVLPEALKPGGNGERMRKVLKTLSSPTLLNNDQLTPLRSQIEASGDYMPGYIGSEESNFVTDDQTMIAAQIASVYADIPAGLANWVTQKIIQDRRASGVRPGTETGTRAFVDKWKATLAKLNAVFEPSKVKALAEDFLRKWG